MIITDEMLNANLGNCLDSDLDNESLDILSDIGRKISNTLKYTSAEVDTACYEAGIASMKESWREAYNSKNSTLQYLCEVYKRACANKWAELNNK